MARAVVGTCCISKATSGATSYRSVRRVNCTDDNKVVNLAVRAALMPGGKRALASGARAARRLGLAAAAASTANS